MTFRRKQNRLPLEEYRGPKAYALTLACADRRAAFSEKTVVETCIEALRSSSQRAEFAVLAYCFMPDHLHFLVQGGDASDLQRFVKDFKQGTGYDYRRLRQETLWQKSYHDHVLRKEEDVREVARYIIQNPVRAGMVRSAADYPYSGSFVWDDAIMEA